MYVYYVHYIMAANIAKIFEVFGGVRPFARALTAATGKRIAPTTVQGWLTRGQIPASRQGDILATARAEGLALGPQDFFEAAAANADGSKTARVIGEAVELLTCGEMGEADRRTIAGGVAGAKLMEEAGRGTARLIMERFPKRPLVVVLCGPGNNGGDGYVIARHLDAAGWRVRVGALVPIESLRGDAAVNARRWREAKGRGAILPVAPALLEGAGLVVDALFGAGLARPLDGQAREMAREIAERSLPVVAVDVPSGLDADTGLVGGNDRDGPSFKADMTVTFFRKKPGHVLYPGRELCGAVRVIDIGIKDDVLGDIAPRTFENLPALWRGAFPTPDLSAHKYSRGHAVIRGGVEMTGAARLAARAAARAGAGLVTICSAPEALAIYALDRAGQLTAAVTTAAEFGAYLADPRRRAVLVGPGNGVGRETRQFVRAALAHRKAVCLDADALTSFADWPAGLFEAISEARAGGAPIPVLTPHDGEFRRLFPDIAARGGRLERARAAAQRSGAVVLLKGADTVIAGPDGRAAINTNAPPWLATGGSGDVLAGLIAGFLVQGGPSFEAAAMAAWIHGEAAKNFGPGLVSDDLPDAILPVLRTLLGM
jgi:hydroxyethylthiazole kinase-like uncharacterized protein yjeF